jgi:CxxC motif-containing protein (DUF1111 family)
MISRPLRLAAPLAALLACLACSGEDPAGNGEEPLPEERLAGGATTNERLGGSNAFTLPAANITPEHERAFFAGNSFFNQNWVQAPASTTARDGLGPLFNARTCSGCHFKDGRGRPPLTEDEAFNALLLRLSVPGRGEHGESLPEPTYGGQLQPFAIDGVMPEASPRVVLSERPGTYADGEAFSLSEPSYEMLGLNYGPLAADVLVSPRVAPAMIGLGLLEAIPEERLRSLADPEDQDGDGISGRLNHVWDVTRQAVTVGRFGWKAEQPTVRQQAAGAFLGDVGITSSLFPNRECGPTQTDCMNAVDGGSPEIADDLLDNVEAYSQLLAVPARRKFAEPDVVAGSALFREIGCASCHVARHETGSFVGRPELEGQVIFPYTDLLLHDMGPQLSDERPSFEAEGNEWRTPPLWGMGHYLTVNGHDRLLHDGRARGVAEAVLWHGGEGEAAREAFRQLSGAERARVVAFVESL